MEGSTLKVYDHCPGRAEFQEATAEFFCQVHEGSYQLYSYGILGL